MITRITPDMPEFAAIAATITPIHRVRRESFPRTVIYAEAHSSSRQVAGRRKETSTKI